MFFVFVCSLSFITKTKNIQRQRTLSKSDNRISKKVERIDIAVLPHAHEYTYYMNLFCEHPTVAQLCDL